LAENLLGRIATVSPSGQPHVVPVAYNSDSRSSTFGGWNLAKSLKFRNLTANPRVAFVVDEVVPLGPWRVRGVEVRGKAEPVRAEDGVTAGSTFPVNIRSWGLGD
jgi:pyridoxamine 5'-phosphate oxidase family protein